MKTAIDLWSLLLPIANLTTQKIEVLGREIYEAEYVHVTHSTHDGEKVKFFSERFEHAFFCSFDSTKHGTKDRLDIHRVGRIRWIGKLICGSLADSECLIVPNERSDRPDKRLYILHSECYVVWLEPLKVGWKFSSAYKPLALQIRKYRKIAKKTIWKSSWGKVKAP
jgi:hypothetical protein